MRRHRQDRNHHEIREAAEALGWLWQDTSQTHLGYDAILVKGGRTVYAEIKDGQKPMRAQRLTPHEVRVHRTLKAHGVTVEILTCVADLVVLSRVVPTRREEK